MVSSNDSTPGAQTTRRSLAKGGLAAILGAGVVSLAGASQAPQSFRIENALPRLGFLILETIPDLLAQLVGTKDPLVALVLGYNSKNDGGGGLFHWDRGSTLPANGGTVFQSTSSSGGRWVRLEV